MSLKFPVPVLEIFHIYDIPERFFTERCNATYFDKLCERIVDLDNIDPSEAFVLPHLHDRYHVMFNYFVQGTVSNSSKYSGPEGRKQILCGIFAIMYTYWDYKFEDISVGINSGIEQLKKYKDESVLNSLPPGEQFVGKWIKEQVDIDKVCWFLENLIPPYNDNFDGVDEMDIETLHLLRDTMTYSPLYSISYYPKELQEIQNYSLILTLISYYGVSTMDEVHKCFNTYFKSPLIHEPYTEFTKNMVEIYNSSRESCENILNNDSIMYMSRYLDEHGNGPEIDNIRAKNPLPINYQMNIY